MASSTTAPTTTTISSLTSSSHAPYCTNCGHVGHVFRNCSSPTTSYGIIAVRFADRSQQQQLFSSTPTIHSMPHTMQFLMIKRRDSISFLEFMRGKYQPSDEAYVGTLLRNMTMDEQARLLTYSFDELWNKMWGEISSVRSHKSNYESSEKKYHLLRDRLPALIETYASVWPEPEWGFPKGRRNLHEQDIQCAIREFQEETGLKRSDFTVITNTLNLSETFYGSNQVHYCHKYYLAVCPPTVDAKWNSSDYYMTREIGDIRWCTLEEAIARIRPDNIEKREIVLKAGKILKNYYPVYTLHPSEPIVSRGISSSKSNALTK